MTAGRGWIALALVVFSSWRPLRLVGGAYLFGAVTILQLQAQGAGLRPAPATDDVAALSRLHHRAGVDFADARHRRVSRARFAGSGVRAGPLTLSPRARATGGALLGKNALPPSFKPGVEDMKKFALAAAAAVLALAATTLGASAAGKLKVGFIYVGPVGDFGWTLPARSRPQEDDGSARRQGRIGLILRTSARVPTPNAPSSSSHAPATS